MLKPNSGKPFNLRPFITAILFIGFIFFLISAFFLQKQLLNIYNAQNSLLIRDRTGKIIFIERDKNGSWARYSDEIPSGFEKLLLKKEDKYFYFHFGFNPWTTYKAALGYFNICPKRASSTITQQLVKILKGKELERNLKNKIVEAFYTFGLELFQSKETILKMYVNSVYFGNQARGLTEASRLYFNLSPDLLADGQILQLLAAISSPTKNNPAKAKNKEIALALAQRLGLSHELFLIDSCVVKETMGQYSHSSNTYFEIQNFIDDSSDDHSLTIDKELTEKIREIVERNIADLKAKNVKNGAVAVIKLPENEILTLVGSPNPKSFEEGCQINMLLEPRPIGSTIKPFVFLKAFEKDLRPYTLADDREYKYITAIGFPLYPKNFDYKYRGEVNLHYALSNSLNVPAVKVLEYVGLEDFYKFLEQDLEFKPIQNLENYQLGIALGVLEMDLLNLSRYFTIFPNNGILKDLKIYNAQNPCSEKKIANPKYIQLINKILSDRKTGIEQFGLKSDFNLFQQNYALKTGTSRDFRDSWVIGYTPDFLVGVWLGNHDNAPMGGISGQLGAGRIWAETMELLLNSEYNKKTPFEFALLKEFYPAQSGIEYGLPDDDYEHSLNALKERDVSLILHPHDGDAFLSGKNFKIILQAKQNVKWSINNEFLSRSKTAIFIPTETGQFQIKAESDNGFQEIIAVYINQ